MADIYICDLDLPVGQRCAVLTDMPSPEPKARVGRAPRRPAGPAVHPPPTPSTQRESECQDAGWEAGFDQGMREAYGTAIRALLDCPLDTLTLLTDGIHQDAADRTTNAAVTPSGAPGAADEIDMAQRCIQALTAAVYDARAAALIDPQTMKRLMNPPKE